MNVVSLLPSATEIVRALGCEDRLVGVSHSCEVEGIPRVTSTLVPYREDSRTIDQYVREHLTGHDALYDLDIGKLQALQPDVVVSQALCDVCAVSTGDVRAAIEALPGRPMLVDLEPNTLDEVFDDIRRVGRALGVEGEAGRLQSDLRARRAALFISSARPGRRVQRSPRSAAGARSDALP